MKKIFSLFICSFLVIHAMGQVSKTDQEFAINYLNSTHQNIVDLVTPLSDEAWNYTPEDGGWSVANCFEHILITENTFFGMAQGILSQSEPSPDFNNSATDGVLIGMMANRGTRVQTAEQFEPSGKWSTKQEMLDALESSRNKLAEYLKSTDANLRTYKAALPFAEIDTYQLFLIIGAHSQRHTFQMQEVLSEMEEM